MSYGSEAYGGGPTDNTAPVVSNIIPAPGTVINAGDEVRFDVTDDSGEFAALLVTVGQLGNGDVVHDGVRFLGLYAELSTREIITNGYRYRVRRTAGWLSRPEFRVYAVDLVGNTN